MYAHIPQTVTILAFIYIPLNTVTSIFGMNVQQINENGHNIGVVAASAVVAFLITGSTWSLIVEANRYKPWYLTAFRDLRPNKAVRPTFEERVFMLVWLIQKRHWRWTVSTGAWWRILIDSKSRMPVVSYTMQQWYIPKDHEKEDWQQRKQACDYMHFALESSAYTLLNPFRYKPATDGLPLTSDHAEPLRPTQDADQAA